MVKAEMVGSTVVNLYIARSPLQVFNCIEASKQVANGHQHILLMVSRQVYDRQLMQRVAQYGEWERIIHWDNPTAIRQVLLVCSALVTLRQVADCFIGDYTKAINFIVNTVQPKRVIWVDDGIATLQRARLLASGELGRLTKHFKPKSKIVSVFEKMLRLDTRYQNSCFFSVYPEIAESLAGFEVVPNQYRYFREKYAAMQIRDNIYFIGNDLRRYVLKDKARFAEYMAQVVRYYTGKQLTYILHRKESAEFMESLAQKLGFAVTRFDDIMEIQLMQQGWYPAEIATFCSSALDTISLLCRPQLTAFRLPLGNIKNDRLVGIQELYRRYENMGVHSVECI